MRWRQHYVYLSRFERSMPSHGTRVEATPTTVPAQTRVSVGSANLTERAFAADQQPSDCTHQCQHDHRNPMPTLALDDVGNPQADASLNKETRKATTGKTAKT